MQDQSRSPVRGGLSIEAIRETIKAPSGRPVSQIFLSIPNPAYRPPRTGLDRFFVALYRQIATDGAYNTTDDLATVFLKML
jgi:hypothetical protein